MHFPKINFHIHSNFSDGKNSIKNIIKKALKMNLDYIAITDHFSNSWKSNIIPTLNSAQKIREYLQTINHFQEYLEKIGSNLNLYKGIEIDLGSTENFVQKLISPNQFDLILMEYLETSGGLKLTDKLISDWKKPYYKYSFPIIGLAHLDPFYFMEDKMDELFELMKRHEIYFEFNSRYPEFYSPKYEAFFLRLKRDKIPVTVGCDSHRLSRLNDYEEPLKMIEYYFLQNNFQSFLDLLKKF